MPGSPRRRWFTALAALLVVTAACSEDDSGEATADTPTSQESADSTTPVEASVDAEPVEDMALGAQVTVSSDEPVRVRLVAEGADGHRTETPETAAVDTDHELPLVGMLAESSYEVTAVLTDEEGKEVGRPTTSVETGPLPAAVPPFQFEAEPDAMAPGLTLVEVIPWGTLDQQAEDTVPDDLTALVMAVDEEGRVVWYHQPGSDVGDVELHEDGTLTYVYFPFGMRRVDLLGEVLNDWNVSPDPDLSAPLTDFAIDAIEAAERNDDGGPEPLPVKTDEVNLESFHHEAVSLPNGNLMALSTTTIPLDEAAQERFCPGDEADFDLITDIVVEFTESGEVVHTWDLADMVDPFEVPGTEMCVTFGPLATDAGRDWSHGNAIVFDEENNAVIVSARHTDQLVAFRYEDDDEGPSGELLWTLGTQGTVEVIGDQPYHQHAPELTPEGDLLVYDNGNGRPGTVGPDAVEQPYSRAVLYDLDFSSDDPSEWTATQVWEHRVEDLDGEPLYAMFLGDVDALPNGNVLVNHGGIWHRPDGIQRGRLIEVVPEGSEGGEIVFDLTMGSEADGGFTMYRAERVPTLYTGPLWRD